MSAEFNIPSEKLMTAQEAISRVHSGDSLVFGHAAGEPCTLVAELIAQKDRLQNVRISHMLPLTNSAHCQPGMESHFKHNALFVGAGSREAVNSGRADFTPVFFSEIPRLFNQKIIPVDVALIQVSTPDENGFCSFGVSVDYTYAAAMNAKLILAEMNACMPHTEGTKIHVEKLDCIVQSNLELPEIPLPKIGEIEEQIGAHIASLIPDGANLQLGIGAIPDAALKFLTHKKDLGIHSEMFSDGVLELVESGVITNKHNNVNPGKMVATFLIGSNKLYRFVNKNPNVLMKPVDYTNNVLVAGTVENLISINSAIQVDLYGQVCADMIGSKQFSGVGGQLDFVRSTSLSKGGKSIIALPSTAKNNTVSRIVFQLDAGACVTTSRNDVHFVVTEYGIADLRGKTIAQRREALIAIAHPNFRDSLKAQIKGV